MTTKMKPLTAKEALFCEAYASVESETYNNGTASAEIAGYSAPSARNVASELRKRPNVAARLQEIYDDNAVGIGEGVSNLKQDRRLAQAKGDVATMVRCDELLGKRHGAFSDHTVIVEPEQQRELDEQEAELARDYAQWSLAKKYGLTMPPAGKVG